MIVPDDLAPAVRHPNATPAGSAVPPHRTRCFGCGVDAPGGLHIQMIASEGTAVSGRITVTPEMQGGPWVIHGGILATLFDEAMGFAQLQLGHIGVTASLTVNYKMPVPIGTTIEIEADCLGVSGRKIYTHATAYLVSDDGQRTSAATSDALFVAIDPTEHKARIEAALT